MTNGVANPIEQAAQALRESRRIVADALEAFGPCDHSVGICNCDMRRSIEQSDAALASLEAAKPEPLTGWQPIETAPNERALLFSPPEALWEDPTGKAGEMRVARPAEWTWARFWMPLPAAPSPGSGT